MSVEITQVAGIRIRVYDQEVVVTEDAWSKASLVLDTIRDYTNCIDVYKVNAVKMVRAACGSGLREAKLMTEAYFEPRFNNFSERGWHRYI